MGKQEKAKKKTDYSALSKSVYDQNRLASQYGDTSPSRGTQLTKKRYEEAWEEFKASNPDADRENFRNIYTYKAKDEENLTPWQQRARKDYEEAAALASEDQAAFRAKQQEDFGALDPMEKRRRGQRALKSISKLGSTRNSDVDKLVKYYGTGGSAHGRGDLSDEDFTKIQGYLESRHGSAAKDDANAILQDLYKPSVSPIQRGSPFNRLGTTPLKQLRSAYAGNYAYLSDAVRSAASGAVSELQQANAVRLKNEAAARAAEEHQQSQMLRQQRIVKGINDQQEFLNSANEKKTGIGNVDEKMRQVSSGIVDHANTLVQQLGAGEITNDEYAQQYAALTSQIPQLKRVAETINARVGEYNMADPKEWSAAQDMKGVGLIERLANNDNGIDVVLKQGVPTLVSYQKDPITGEVVTDAEGNPVEDGEVNLPADSIPKMPRMKMKTANPITGGKIGETNLIGLDALVDDLEKTKSQKFEYEQAIGQDGQPLVGDNGEPIVRKDQYGNPVMKRDANGYPIIKDPNWKESVFNSKAEEVVRKNFELYRNTGGTQALLSLAKDHFKGEQVTYMKPDEFGNPVPVTTTFEQMPLEDLKGLLVEPPQDGDMYDYRLEEMLEEIYVNTAKSKFIRDEQYDAAGGRAQQNINLRRQQEASTNQGKQQVEAARQDWVGRLQDANRTNNFSAFLGQPLQTGASKPATISDIRQSKDRPGEWEIIVGATEINEKGEGKQKKIPFSSKARLNNYLYSQGQNLGRIQAGSTMLGAQGGFGEGPGRISEEEILQAQASDDLSVKIQTGQATPAERRAWIKSRRQGTSAFPRRNSPFKQTDDDDHKHGGFRESYGLDKTRRLAGSVGPIAGDYIPEDSLYAQQQQGNRARAGRARGQGYVPDAAGNFKYDATYDKTAGVEIPSNHMLGYGEDNRKEGVPEWYANYIKEGSPDVSQEALLNAYSRSGFAKKFIQDDSGNVIGAIPDYAISERDQAKIDKQSEGGHHNVYDPQAVRAAKEGKGWVRDWYSNPETQRRLMLQQGIAPEDIESQIRHAENVTTTAGGPREGANASYNPMGHTVQFKKPAKNFKDFVDRQGFGTAVQQYAIKNPDKYQNSDGRFDWDRAEGDLLKRVEQSEAVQRDFDYNQQAGRGAGAHEIVHASGFDAVVGDYAKKLLGPQQGNSDYYGNPREIYGNLTDIRYKLGLKPGQKMGVKEFKAKLKASGIDANENDFLKSYKTENIVKTLNTVAENDSQPPKFKGARNLESLYNTGATDQSALTRKKKKKKTTKKRKKRK